MIYRGKERLAAKRRGGSEENLPNKAVSPFGSHRHQSQSTGSSDTPAAKCAHCRHTLLNAYSFAKLKQISPPSYNDPFR